VTVAGYDGIYLELTAPTDIDHARCGGQVDHCECDGRGTRLVDLPGIGDWQPVPPVATWLKI
jgi:hypothetical protein